MSTPSQEETMTSFQQAQRYFDAWNAQDATAIVATFAPSGTYVDPTTPGPLRGEAIGQYAAGLWSAFPDLSFELVSAAPCGDGVVAAQWVMRGTNHGSMFGLPPTGKQVELPGADFIVVEDAGLRSVTGYFDSGLLPRQLGLNIVVQPHQVGPFTFGTSNAVQSGKPAVPGAISFTSLVLREPSEGDFVRTYSRQIAPEMLAMQGFISYLGIGVGDRMLTVSTWETPEDPKQLLNGGTHKDSIRHFFGEGYYRGGVTSVWQPVRYSFNARCDACGKMHHQREPITSCACGAPLSVPANIW
jgi:steroid delta-isomerase-like uncharacterized protein